MEALKSIKAARWIPAFAGMTVLLFSFCVKAEDAKPADQPPAPIMPQVVPTATPPGTYSPADCEFTINFPDDPYVSHHCDANNPTHCYDQVSYTKVYDMDSTVNFRAICNPTSENMYGQYSGKVMQSALKALTARSTVKTYNSTFREETDYKQAGLVGEGQVGVNPMIYIAQLWIGHHSVLTVEAEMIGKEHDRADGLFTQVLKSIGFVKGKQVKELDSKPAKQ